MSQKNIHTPHHHVRPPEPVLTPSDHASAQNSVSTESIAKRAYERFLARGGAHGADRDDWFAAERELTTGAFKSP
jgi:hypothetical protein